MNIRHFVIIGVWLLSMRSASAQFTIGETEKAIETYKRAQILAELERLKSPITASPSIESHRSPTQGDGLGRSVEAITGEPEPNLLAGRRPRPTWESLSSEFDHGAHSTSRPGARQVFSEFDSRMHTIGEEVIGEPMAQAWHGETSHPQIAIGASDFPIQYVRIGGLLQVDAGIVNQDAAAVATVGDWTNNATIRRARLRTDANLTDNVAVGLEFDFAFLNRVNPTEAYIALNQTLPLGDVRVGLFRQPIGLDALTDDADVTFMERSLPVAFSPFRQVGIGLHRGSPHGCGTFDASAFYFPTGFDGGIVTDDGGVGMAIRATRLLGWQGNPRRLFHLGGGFSLVGAGENAIRYANTQEYGALENSATDFNAVTQVLPFVDTGALAVNNFGLLSTELAGVCDSFHYQVETVFNTANVATAGRANFFGASAQCGYFLTGESRPYDFQRGVFSRVAPCQPLSRCGGIGAWEVAGRWSYLDLNDGAVAGGRLNNWTFGLNWYLNRYTEFQFNYIRSDLARGIDSKSGTWALRAQVSF